MPHYRYECFCRLSYASELTYEELIECEQALSEGMQELLEKAGAVHADFFPDGDCLYVQWVFPALEPADFEQLTGGVAKLAGNRVQGRILLVDKQLDRIRLGLAASGRGRVLALDLPEVEEALDKKTARVLLN